MFDQTNEVQLPPIVLDINRLADTDAVINPKRPKAILNFTILTIQSPMLNIKLGYIRKTLQKTVSKLSIDCTALNHQKYTREVTRHLLMCRRVRIPLYLQIMYAQDYDIKNLMANIRHLPNVVGLELSFSPYFRATLKSFHILCSTLNNLVYLSHLSMNFQNSSQVTDVNLDILQNSFKYLAHLSHLHVNLNHSYSITDRGVKVLSSAIGRVKSLTSLGLMLDINTKITDESLTSVSLIFKNLGWLQSLKLNLRRCGGVSTWGIQSLSNQLKHVSLLTRLDLSFSDGVNIFGEGMSSLFLSLQNFVHLSILKISIPTMKITTEAWNSFSTALKQLTKLSIFELDASRNNLYVDSQVFDSIFSSLQDLKFLSILSIKFIDCKRIMIRDNNFAAYFSNHVHLTNLNLNFNACVQISNHCLEKLSLGLAELNSLSVLELNFSACKEISDQGIECLSKGLK